jgi:hypothetical protein
VNVRRIERRGGPDSAYIHKTAHLLKMRAIYPERHGENPERLGGSSRRANGPNNCSPVTSCQRPTALSEATSLHHRAGPGLTDGVTALPTGVAAAGPVDDGAYPHGPPAAGNVLIATPAYVYLHGRCPSTGP